MLQNIDEKYMFTFFNESTDAVTLIVALMAMEEPGDIVRW